MCLALTLPARLETSALVHPSLLNLDQESEYQYLLSNNILTCALKSTCYKGQNKKADL